MLVLLLLLSRALLAQDSGIPKPERHEFTITDFHTEGGVVLPQARIVYGTYGKLNAAKDNAVVLPSHYMASATWLSPAGE
jgi:homoserine O-acetyltransferase